MQTVRFDCLWGINHVVDQSPKIQRWYGSSTRRLTNRIFCSHTKLNKVAAATEHESFRLNVPWCKLTTRVDTNHCPSSLKPGEISTTHMEYVYIRSILRHVAIYSWRTDYDNNMTYILQLDINIYQNFIRESVL